MSSRRARKRRRPARRFVPPVRRKEWIRSLFENTKRWLASPEGQRELARRQSLIPFATYLWMDSPNGRPEDPNIIEGEAVEVVPEDRRLVMGFDPAEPGVDVTVMSVSLVSDPLPPYGQIRVLPSSSPTDSPRPTS